MLRKIMHYVILVVLIFTISLLLVSCSSQRGEESAHFAIGLVTNNANGLKNVQGFQDEMAVLGYVEGENVSYIFAGQPTSGDALDAALADMVAQNVDLIFTAGTPTGVAAHRITADSGIPVVFGVIADPIAAGVMQDLMHPGGNMTGVMLSQNQARRLELLLEILPNIQRVYLPYNPDDPAPTSAAAQVKELAPNLGIEIVEGFARNDDEVTVLLDSFPEDMDAIFMLPDSTVNARMPDLIALAIDLKLPVSGPSMAQVEGGALMAYGIIHHEVGAQAAHIAVQVLEGADPAELPVETAEFYLGINMQTADAIGLEIPAAFLHSAALIVRAQPTE